MQSPNPLMVLSVMGAVVAASTLAAAPATAESGSRIQTSAQAAQPASSAAPTPINQSAISQSDRLDQLQTESQLRQQLNQSQFGVSQPSSNSPNSLRFDQQVQQQINLQEMQSTQQNMGTRPSSALDQLQFEQRVRGMQPPSPQPTRPTEQSKTASRAGSPADSPADAQAIVSQAPAPTTPTAEPAAELTPQQQRRARRWVKQATERLTPPKSAEIAQAETAQAETAPTETAQAESRPLNLPSSPSSAPNGSGSRQTEPGDSSNLYSGEGFAPDNPAPEYLNPDANPLTFPTSPSEVEITGTQPITIRQAIELALRNNPTFRQAQFQLERSQADLRRSQASNLPTLDASANFTQSGRESVSKVPESSPDGFGNDIPNTTINAQGQRVPNPRIGQISRVYNDSTLLGAGLQANYSIFTSGRRSALIRAADQQVRIQQLEVERQAEQLILDTVGDYYDLQDASAQVNIFQANLVQAEQSLRDAQALERAGVGTRFDSLQAEVDVANARQRLTQQLSTLEIAQRQLAQRLNISQAVDLTAADPIEVAGVWDLSLEETIVQAYKNRVELEQQLVQRDIAEQNRKAALATLGPQVGFQGAFNLTSNIDADASLGYDYSLALNASLALFDGGDARSQANREESNISIAEAEFENQRDTIRLNIEQGYSRLNSSFANIQTTALAVTQATEALRLARLRFQAGVGTQTDVLRQQSVLAEAQVNNLTAILDYNRALAVLQRGTSNYPEGYLNDLP